jgi:hypothetical protein
MSSDAGVRARGLDDLAAVGEISELMHHAEHPATVGDLPCPEAGDLTVAEQDYAVLDGDVAALAASSGLRAAS